MTWKKITTLNKQAGLRILDAKEPGDSRDKAVLYCSTTERVFGPVFDEYNLHYKTSDPHDTAQEFIDWHHATYNQDPRSVDVDELANRKQLFHQKFHTFSPWEGKQGLCGDCGLHYDRHAEAKIGAGETCGRCNGSAVEENGGACYRCDGAGKETNFSTVLEHSGRDDDGNFIENDVEDSK